jgi:DtxR family Mn-dependent transcriptional regulator
MTIEELRPTGQNLSQAVEDYLRTILLLEEHSITPTLQHIRELLGVSLATVSGTLKRLERESLLYRDEKHRVHLTPVGKVAAQCVMRRNRLVERFLYDVLQVPLADLAGEANRMEHAVSPRLERHLYLLLERPIVCPHGNPIDPDAVSNDSRLASFRFGRIEITRVLEAVASDRGFMTWMESRGVLPGRRFQVVGSSNSRIVLADDDGTVGVPRPAAELIMAGFANEVSQQARR